MNRWSRSLLLAAAAVFCVGAAHAEGEKRQKGVYKAERAGWLLGMYVGEERSNPHPFVLKIEEKSEAALKGVRVGDELIRFDDREVRQLRPVFERINDIRPGKEVTLWMRRGSQTMQYTLRVPKPEKAGEAATDEKKPEGEKSADEAKKDEKKEKKSKKKPVVIKPIPTPDE
ncbi:MAG: PDZ domain-containing protein [Armatimonadota bacterium]